MIKKLESYDHVKTISVRSSNRSLRYTSQAVPYRLQPAVSISRVYFHTIYSHLLSASPRLNLVTAMVKKLNTMPT